MSNSLTCEGRSPSTVCHYILLVWLLEKSVLFLLLCDQLLICPQHCQVQVPHGICVSRTLCTLDYCACD